MRLTSFNLILVFIKKTPTSLFSSPFFFCCCWLLAKIVAKKNRSGGRGVGRGVGGGQAYGLCSECGHPKKNTEKIYRKKIPKKNTEKSWKKIFKNFCTNVSLTNFLWWGFVVPQEKKFCGYGKLVLTQTQLSFLSLSQCLTRGCLKRGWCGWSRR